MASAKIFRINYKSDFILTLTSDAGWMTPFCIKFWTGAPSQAYFVGWDGDTYDHCSFDPSEPTKLQVQFDDHHLPIGDLKYQVAYHFNVADFPNDTEDEVINAANITTEIDGETYQVMLDFTGETAPEIQFALPAYANEAQRIANEQQRIANETQRIANEETRIQHEQQRINQEQARQQNEQQRINQEQARVNEYATLKADAVAATSAANDAAALANQKAQLAADKAALAQAAADLANAKAQLAADKAALAASAAQLANDKAALAQQKAEYAQTQGGYAKDQGDYAKDQGDYAKAKGDYAKDQGDYAKDQGDYAKDKGDICAEDHQTAVADHQTAQSDHTTAGTDHTTAQSDHTTASNDHIQAGNDHTRAESDHTRAESDHAAVEVYVDSLGVFDLSKHNAVGGVLATYADLSAALTALNALDSKYKYGGMSFKFVLTSDNKYIQARCMAQNFTTNVSQWQGVDDEPTAGSDNLVKSGGVIESIGYIPFSATAGGKTGNVYVLGTVTAPGLITKGGFKIIINSETAQDVFYVREFDKNGTNLGSVLLTGEYIVVDNNDIYGISVFKGGTVDTAQYKVDIAIVSRQFFSNEKAITALNNSFATDTVHLTSQSLSIAQKEQVKDNLGIEEHKQTSVIVDDYESLATPMDWSPAINAAIIDAVSSRQGNYSFGVVEFTEGKQYVINDSVKITGDVILKGNGATLKRANGEKVSVTQAIDSTGSDVVHVSAILGNWKVGDKVYIINGNTKNDVLSGSDITITGIDNSNNIITLSSTVKDIPVDADMIRSFFMVEGEQYPLQTIVKIYNLTFDGNMSKNNYSYYWYINATLSVYGYGTIIDSCKFVNIPNECIVTSGAVVTNCHAENLNGSFVHLSCPAKNKLTYSQFMGTRITNNRVISSNKISPTITGHSWAVIEQSWNPGFLLVANNYFSGYNVSSCFEIQSPTPESTGTDFTAERKYVIIANNIFENYARISRTPEVSQQIKDKIMINNIFKHCGTTDWTTLFNHELIIDTNIYCDGTVVNSGGNSYRYRVNNTYDSAPTKATLSTDYVSLPAGGDVFASQINKLYKKILTAGGVEDWLEVQLV